MLKPKSSIAHDAAGRFKARAKSLRRGFWFEATFIFVFGGAIFLISHSFYSESVSARLLHDRSRVQDGSIPRSVMAPDQHRAPVARPIPAPLPMQRRADPIQIDPSQRHEIVQHQANEMKREHCLRKLEARRRALLEKQRAERANPAK